MVPPRIIPVLLYNKESEGLVKTFRFKKPVYIGDAINAVKIFNEKEVDEIILLDISATAENRKPEFQFVWEIAGECFMPLGYGGGITALQDIEILIRSGVEKVILNSAAVERPAFISEAVKNFGTSTIVVSIDVKKDTWGNSIVFSQGGTKKSRYRPIEFATIAEQMGAGEIMLNAIDRDGTQQGYDLELIHKVASAVTVPLIACGGAGNVQDLYTAINAGANAAAAGSMFVFSGKQRAVLINFPNLQN